MTELELKIKEAAQKYYTDGSSELADAEFDALVDQLRLENPNSELLKTIGWGYSVTKDNTPEVPVISAGYNWGWKWWISSNWG